MVQKKTKLLLLALLLAACSTAERAEDAADAGKGLRQRRSGALLQSLSANKLAGPQPNKAKAQRQVSKLEAALDKKEEGSPKDAYFALIAAERIAGVPFEQLLHRAQSLAELELQQGIVGSDWEGLKLELALAALKQGKYGYAATTLEELSSAKNKRVRAGAKNALGLLAIYDEHIPEAVRFWQEALQAAPDYEAALLNLGYLSLKYGAFEEAQKYFERLGADNGIVQSGLEVAVRLNGDNKQAGQLCALLLAQDPPHKPSVFNCGVYEWQARKNIPKAKKLMKQALNLEGGPADWASRGAKTLESLP